MLNSESKQQFLEMMTVKQNDGMYNATQQNRATNLLIAKTALQQSIFENTGIIEKGSDLLIQLITHLNTHNKTRANICQIL